MKKFLIYTILIIVVGLLIFFLTRYYYVFGRGVKAGQLNYVVQKGYIFKTYEGKLIQSGFRATTPGAVQSYEFEFSIENKRIADTLMLNSGKEVEVHYKEYLGSVPWRGYSEFIVDSVISIHDVK
jgi:hypothetical protein